MKRGAAWEAKLARWHADYRAAERAVIFQSHPPVKMIGGPDRDGEFRAVFAGHGPPDFVGLVAGGPAVVFDAKDEQSTSWQLSKLCHRRASMPHHQATDLDAAQYAGAFAFVALRIAGDGGHVLPWTVLGPLYWAWVDAGMPPRRTTADHRAIGLPMAADGWLSRVPQ